MARTLETSPLAYSHPARSPQCLQVEKQRASQYGKLATAGEFRLLTLHPGTPSEPEVITGSLRHAVISVESQKYIALSYVWGSPEPQRSILLDGRPFQVRENLYLFLQTYCTTTTDKFVVWVDAICINQDDILERNHQVQMMPHIYAGALGIYAWLGPSTCELDALFTCINLYAEHSAGIDLASPSDDTYADVEFLFPSKRDVFHEAIRDIMARLYWTRLWVVQEVVAARVVVFWVGTHFFEKKLLHQLVNKGGIRGIEESHRKRINDLSRLDEAPHSFRTLINRFGSLHCEDRHDKVYALLGLAKLSNWDTRCSHHQASSFEVQYDEPLTSLFARVINTFSTSRVFDFAADLATSLGLCGEMQGPGSLCSETSCIDINFRTRGTIRDACKVPTVPFLRAVVGSGNYVFDAFFGPEELPASGQIYGGLAFSWHEEIRPGDAIFDIELGEDNGRSSWIIIIDASISGSINSNRMKLGCIAKGIGPLEWTGKEVTGCKEIAEEIITFLNGCTCSVSNSRGDEREMRVLEVQTTTSSLLSFLPRESSRLSHQL